MIWQVLSQKYDEKRHGNVTHALNISAGRMPIVPDKEKSFEHFLDDFTFANHQKVRSDSLDISIDDLIDLLLILSKSLRFPVILEELTVLASFFVENLLGIID